MAKTSLLPPLPSFFPRGASLYCPAPPAPSAPGGFRSGFFDGSSVIAGASGFVGSTLGPDSLVGSCSVGSVYGSSLGLAVVKYWVPPPSARNGTGVPSLDDVPPSCVDQVSSICAAWDLRTTMSSVVT